MLSPLEAATILGLGVILTYLIILIAINHWSKK